MLARRKRTNLHLSAAALVLVLAVLSAVPTTQDATGVVLRVAMIMAAFGAAAFLSWRLLVPAVVVSWLVPNLVGHVIDDTSLLSASSVLELAGLAGVALFTALAHGALQDLEEESVILGTANGDLAGINPQTGIFYASQLRPSLQAELARSRRFHRTFALVLAGIDEMRQKFDYRDDDVWKASLDATTRLLRRTRHNVDRVYHFKDNGFAMILPEAGEKDIVGLVNRLRRLGRSERPSQGKPGGPLPVHFGATFFPDRATTVDDLLHRAEVALRLAADNSTRYHLDSAEAPALPPPETLRSDATEGSAGPAPRLSDPSADAGRAELVLVGGTPRAEGGKPAIPDQPEAVAADPGMGPALEGLQDSIEDTLGMIRSLRAGKA